MDVEPCLCAWYQCVPGACPITCCGGLYFGGRMQYGKQPAQNCGNSLYSTSLVFCAACLLCSVASFFSGEAWSSCSKRAWFFCTIAFSPCVVSASMCRHACVFV